MKGSVIIFATSVVAGLVASLDTPTPEAPAKVDRNSTTDSRSYVDSFDKADSHALMASKEGDSRGTGRSSYGFGDSHADWTPTVGPNHGAPGSADNFEIFPESGNTAVLMPTDPAWLMPVARPLRERIPPK